MCPRSRRSSSIGRRPPTTRDTHALIRDMKWPAAPHNTPGLQKNDDGSMDVYFGPKAPDGKETNWVPTDPKAGFEVLFRLYGPEKAFLRKNGYCRISRRSELEKEKDNGYASKNNYVNGTVPVTADNFIRAETDRTFDSFVKKGLSESSTTSVGWCRSRTSTSRPRIATRFTR